MQSKEAEDAVSMATPEVADPRILERPEHTLSRSNIADAALKVLYRLHRAGYLAYLVGGGVRDLLLGRRPKDFDIVTNARPQEIRRLFRNSRVIGRRFRLVHVMFRGEVVEVATFRASPEAPEGPDDWEDAAAADAEEDAESEVERPPLRRDDDLDAYGTPAEDAWRRDFTVNALFYNIGDFSVIDYVGGIQDLEAGVIRTIGEPERRFREDPVRMLRAAEYAVRLGFAIEPATMAAVGRTAGMIREASRARLTYELLETLRSGSAASICSAWQGFGLFGAAFPRLGELDRDTVRVLEAVDREVAEGRTHPDAALLGTFFLARGTRLLAAMTRDGQRLRRGELLDQLRDLVDPTGVEMHLPNHAVHLMHQGLFTLAKIARPPERGRQVLKLARQDYFRVALDLARLAAAAGLSDPGPVAAWTRAVAKVERGEVDAAVPQEESPRSRRRRRPRRRRRS